MSNNAASTSTRVSPYRVFRNQNFRWMWTGQLVETMGMALTSLAASILVFRLTNSAMSVSLMLMATAIPSLLVGLFAGVVVDRYDRKKIMIISDVIRGVLVLLIPFLVPLSVVWLYVIVILTSAIGQFFDPAHESVLPELASDAELAAANSLMAISSFGSTAIGFAASGLIASAASISWAFYLNALTFLFSAFCIFKIRIKPLQVEEITKASVIIENLKLGVKHLFDTPILRSLFIVGIPVIISIGLSNALLLPFASRALNATEFEYGLQEALTSVGFVVASLLIAGVFDRMREGAWMSTGYIAMALAGIVYAFLHSIPLAIIVVTISGFFNAPSAIGRNVAIQRNTPREVRGRVNSVFFVSRDILFLIGMGIAGLADSIDIRIMYLISAIFMLGGGMMILFMPGLRQNKAEWLRAIQLLKTAPVSATAGEVRAATPADMDALVILLPALNSLSTKERKDFINEASVVEAAPGSAILRNGEAGDSAYFILAGRAIAGKADESGSYHSLSTMTKGDFFGEIAALTGAARTADVVSEEPTTLLRIPAATLRNLMSHPELSDLFLTKIGERLARTSIKETPRFIGIDQQDALELRMAPVEK